VDSEGASVNAEAKSRSYTLSIEEENGSFWGEVVELPGCFAAGRDLNELLEAAAEAIRLYELPAKEPEDSPDNVVALGKKRRVRRHKSPGPPFAVQKAEILLEA